MLSIFLSIKGKTKSELVCFVFSKELLQDGRMKIQLIDKNRTGSYWPQKATSPYPQTLIALPTLP